MRGGEQYYVIAGVMMGSDGLSRLPSIDHGFMNTISGTFEKRAGEEAFDVLV